jgi:type II secretory pathway component PulM
VKINSREKTVIIIGAVIAVCVMIFYVATLLVPDSQILSRNVDLKKRMLRSQLDKLSHEDSYKQSREQYQKHLAQDMTRFLPGDNPSLAGADLQKIVKDFADQSGVEITQRNILPEKKIQDLATKVSVRMDTSCSLEQLVQLLSRIENYEKMLKVDEMQMIRLQNPRRMEVRTTLTISGYIALPPEKPAEKPAPKAENASVS